MSFEKIAEEKITASDYGIWMDYLKVDDYPKYTFMKYMKGEEFDTTVTDLYKRYAQGEFGMRMGTDRAKKSVKIDLEKSIELIKLKPNLKTSISCITEDLSPLYTRFHIDKLMIYLNQIGNEKKIINHKDNFIDELVSITSSSSFEMKERMERMKVPVSAALSKDKAKILMDSDLPPYFNHSKSFHEKFSPKYIVINRKDKHDLLGKYLCDN